MPKATKSSKMDQCNIEVDNNQVTSDVESTSSDHKVFFNPQLSTSTITQEMPSVYMTYIGVPTMDWVVNYGSCNRFLKW